MFDVLLFGGSEVFQSKRAEINLEESAACDLDMHVFKQSINAGSEGNDSSIDRHVVFPLVDIVSDDLYGKVRCWVETVLRKEDCTYTLGVLKMAKLESYILFKPV